MGQTDRRAGEIVGVADPDFPGSVFHPSYLNGAAVTKSDSTVFSGPTAALWIGGVGDVAVRFAKGQNSLVLVAVPAGSLLKVAVDQVLSTGTSATNIVRFF